MTLSFEEWKSHVSRINARVEEASAVLESAEGERRNFFRQTVGFAPGDPATIEGTVEMIAKVGAMVEAGKQ